MNGVYVWPLGRTSCRSPFLEPLRRRFFLRSRLVREFGLDQARLEFLTKPITLAFNVDGDRMIQQLVENRGGNDRISEDLAHSLKL